MNETLKNVMNELDSTFRILSTIPVAGDAVDAMAAARSKLRKVAAQLEAVEKQAANGADRAEPDHGDEIRR